jgi:hypothetical protein
MKTFFKRFFIALLLALVVIQFIRPEGNQNEVVAANTLAAALPVSNEVNDVLKAACNDCHSNNSVPMWYMKIQPVGFWIDHHIEEGKGELNFDEFATYSLRRQYHKLEEVAEMVNEREMPLESYTWMHSEAKLTDVQKKLLTDWSAAMMDTLEARWPMDSLVKPQQQQPEHKEGEEH